MSDPKLQRADGCSVFFSLILGLVFVSAYFIFQIFFDIEESSDTNPLVSERRRQKVESYETNSMQFENSVDQFHRSSNSTLESSMLKTVEKYTTGSQNLPNSK
tara:strand:- start:74 stop:382 length:309 start_codon:yes stop_codon:yes gene_type:complete